MKRIILALTFIAVALAFTPTADAFHHGRGCGKRGLRAVGKVATAPVRLLKKLCH